MEDLIQQATEFLEKRYKRPIHTVAAALETAEGKLYLGVNINHFSGFVCAETSALTEAMNNGEKSFARLIAVRRDENGQIDVANPCGKCRQIFYDYAPGVIVGVSDGEEVETPTIEDLLPYSFKRQRKKIQAVLNDENVDEVAG